MSLVLSISYCELSKQKTSDVSTLDQPGPGALLWNSVTFLFASAGPGTYFLRYHSYKLDRIVAQIDYNPERDSAAPGESG